MAMLVLAMVFGTPAVRADLIGHWKFDEGAGSTASDSSASSHEATQAGTAGSWVSGKSGSAYQFGGSGSRFELADSSDLQVTGAVTVSAWVNPIAASTFGLIAGIDQTGGSANDMYTLKTDGSDRPRWDVVAGGDGSNISLDADDTLTNFSAAAADGWVHVVGVFDPGVAAYLYVNGAENASDTTDIPTSIQLTGTDFQFGHNASDNGNNPLQAAIDDVQVYDQALTSTEVATLFSNPGFDLFSVSAGSVLMGAPSAGSITDDGATVEAELLGADATDVTLVWAETDQGETEISTWTSAPGGGSHSFGPASEEDILSHAITGLDGDTQYFFRFFATAGADSDWSAAGIFATGLGGSPAPAELAGTAGVTPVSTTVTLTWTDSYATETGFVIQRSTDPGFGGTPDEFSVGADETSFTDDTTGSNTTYYYRIAAVGSSGPGPFSSNLEVSTGNAPEPGLLGHWTFDEGAGVTASDSSANSNDATQAGAAGSWVSGKSGSAYQFGGSNSRFELADSSDLQVTGAVTVSTWVNPTAASTFGLIAGIDQTGGSANDMYTLKTDGSDRPRWDVVAGGDGSNVSLDANDTLTNFSAATADGWVHVVGVFDPGVAAYLYVNGVENASDTTEIPTSIQLTAIDFQFGHNASDNGSNPLQAAIDDVQVYNLAASAEDVAFLYNNPGRVLGEDSSFPLSIVRTGEQLQISWVSQPGKLYDLLSNLDLQPEPSSWESWDGNVMIPATPPRNSLTIDLPSDPSRYFAVREYPTPPVVVYNDDFENGQGGWTTSGGPTPWEIGNPDPSVTGGPGAAFSGDNVFGTDLDGGYAENSDSVLVSPPIDLSVVVDATLAFQMWTDIEVNFDLASIRVLDAADDSEIVVLADAIDGTATQWREQSFALPVEAIGKSVKIEFRLVADDFNASPQAGLYIDDVQIEGSAP